jgi:hypothetical protein
VLLQKGPARGLQYILLHNIVCIVTYEIIICDPTPRNELLCAFEKRGKHFFKFFGYR